ncbi:MAG: FecR domain-containing protein [Thermoguttaceae bacterium]
MSKPSRRDYGASPDGLIQAYLEGEITPEEEQEFVRLLSKPEFRRQAAEYAIDAAVLYELGQQGVLGPSASGESTSRRWRGRRSRRAVFWVAASLLAAIGCGFLLLRGWDQAIGRRRPEIGQVVRIEGRMIVNHDGLSQVVEQERAVCDNDTILLSGLAGFALLKMEDGTEFSLTGDTKVTGSREDGQVRIQLHEGQLSAHVMPQSPSKPLIIVTPAAEIYVLGTSLAVSADGQTSELGVQEGRVRMKRLSDGRFIEVGTGQFAVASARSQLAARPWPAVPDQWGSDFEAGLPEGWRFGQWVNDGLPEGCRGGVHAARRFAIDGHESDLYRITSPREWTRGLFRIAEDSTLHFTYKMERPGWFHIMMGARSSGFTPLHVGNYEGQDARWSKVPPGQWQTASIPLASFRKTVRSGLAGERAGNRPRAGDVAYLLWLNTAGIDRGLVIDRIWISRDNVSSERTP